MKLEWSQLLFTDAGIVSSLSSVETSSGQDPSVAQNDDPALVLVSLVEPFKANFLWVFWESVAGILCYIPNVSFNRNRQTYRDKSSRKNDDCKKKNNRKPKV